MMPPETQATHEPTLKETLAAVDAYPKVLEVLKALQGQMQAIQGEIQALRRVSGSGGAVPIITWREAKEKRFVSLKQAAYLLNVSEWTVRRQLKRGLLKCSSATRHKLISVESLEKFSENTIL
jgi:hypothetical protein